VKQCPWVILTMLVLTACASATRVNNSSYGSYSASTAIYAAPNGKMALSVYGNPTTSDEAAVAQAIADAMLGTHVDYHTKFIPTSPAKSSGYRTVIVFGKANEGNICSPDVKALATDGSPGPMASAFCANSEALSFASGRVPQVGNANDPLLASQVSIMSTTIFPIVNPNYQDDCELGGLPC
jgi:hypothetical protein